MKNLQNFLESELSLENQKKIQGGVVVITNPVTGRRRVRRVMAALRRRRGQG